MNFLQCRCVTHPAMPSMWIVEARLYDDVWTTVDGPSPDLFSMAQQEAWLTGLTT